MMKLLQSRWSPWVAGAGLGLLSWLTLATMGQALGTSTTAVRAVGAVERAVAPEHVAENPYLSKYLGRPGAEKPAIEWQFALVLFLPLGAWVSGRLQGERRREHVPQMWRERFGDSRGKRYLFAFVGGAIMLFGARMAGGCTSGHGLSGTSQLAVSSWIFLPVLFISGIVTARLLYGKETRHG